MTLAESTEVLVVGGGPAGAVCALALAKLGRDVVLCEAKRFPRDHIGISLSPGVSTQLDFLELGALLQHPAHQPSVLVERRWATEMFVSLPHMNAFIADRARLDIDLLAAAAERGVRILQPARVLDWVREPQGWSVGVSTPSGTKRLQCLFILDGSGRRSRFHCRRRLGTATIAVCGIWTGDVQPIVRLSAGPESWSWTAPIGPNQRVAVAFASPQKLHRSEGNLEARYRRLIFDAELLDTGLALTTKPYAYDATPYAAEENVNGLLRIGDADVALDPLSSSGVQAAVQSALCAAPVVNTLLSHSGDWNSALSYWEARRASRAESHRVWAAERYAEVLTRYKTDFWMARAAAPVATPVTVQPTTRLPRPEQPVQLSKEAALLQAPCLVDDMVRGLECLIHPSLSEPVAFVDGAPLHPLLSGLHEPKSAQALIAVWSLVYPPERALALLGWLWRRNILVAARTPSA